MTSASDSAIWTMTRLLDTVARRRVPAAAASCACPHLEHVHRRDPRGAERRHRSEDAAVASAIAAVNAMTRQSNDRSSAIRSTGVDN